MEQTTKYSLSGWRSSSLLLLLVWLNGFGQSRDSAARTSLDARYSLAVLEAHQANSLQKIADFYHYLNLFSATNDKALQSQLRENIYALFTDKNVLVEDITTDGADQIPLSFLLDNIASKEITFTIVNEQVSLEFYLDYWFDSYALEITSGGQTKKRQLRQAVYFRPERKLFGLLGKTVLAVSLGTIE